MNPIHAGVPSVALVLIKVIDCIIYAVGTRSAMDDFIVGVSVPNVPIVAVIYAVAVVVYITYTNVYDRFAVVGKFVIVRDVIAVVKGALDVPVI